MSIYLGNEQINNIGVKFEKVITGKDLQEKTVVPTEETQEIVPDSNYEALSKVNIEAISPNYVGSNIYILQEIFPDAGGNSAALYLVAWSLSGMGTGGLNGRSILIDKHHTLPALTVAEKNSLLPFFVTSDKSLLAKTYIPTKSTQIISSGKYLTEDQTIAPIPDNYVNTSDATATAEDIMAGKIAYVNGKKIIGTYTG